MRYKGESNSIRRYPRYRLRTLLIVMLVMSMGLGWLGWKCELARKQQKAVAWVQEMGGSVTYDYEVGEKGYVALDTRPPGPECLRSLLGIDFFAEVVDVNMEVCDVGLHDKGVEDLTPLAGMTRLHTLVLIGTQVSDLTPLARMTGMKRLYLSRSRVSDLTPLAHMTSLHTLDLDGTQVSDLAPLAHMKTLHTLDLDGTQVSDLAPLARMSNMERHERLYLSRTQVSDLAPLIGMTKMEWLSLNGALVTDISPLSELQQLNISLDKWQTVSVPSELKGKVKRTSRSIDSGSREVTN